MTTQTTLFPKTELDEATAVLAHLISEEEKADKAADAAGQKAADTASRVRKQRHVVAKLQAMMPAAEPIVDSETAPEDIEDAEILQIEGDVLDPITGEVTSNIPVTDEEKRDELESKMNAERGEPNISVVIVLYPGSDEPVVTKIGEHTRYGELVADYFTAAGLNGKHSAKAWAIVAEDELTMAGGGVRKLRDVITGADYGKRLLVVAADQGSVTGVAADEESDA